MKREYREIFDSHAIFFFFFLFLRRSARCCTSESECNIECSGLEYSFQRSGYRVNARRARSKATSAVARRRDAGIPANGKTNRHDFASSTSSRVSRVASIANAESKILSRVRAVVLISLRFFSLEKSKS